eukprot:4863634-Prymnesium_polylepis.1
MAENVCRPALCGRGPALGDPGSVVSTHAVVSQSGGGFGPCREFWSVLACLDVDRRRVLGQLDVVLQRVRLAAPLDQVVPIGIFIEGGEGA